MEKAKLRVGFDAFNRMGGIPEIALMSKLSSQYRTWTMSGDSEDAKATRKREIDGIVEAAETLKCEDLTIVTHDEAASITERGHHISVVPAWKYLLCL